MVLWVLRTRGRCSVSESNVIEVRKWFERKNTQAIRRYQRDHRNAEGVHADRKSAPSQCAHQDGSGGRLGRAAADEFRLDLPQPHCPFSSRRAAGVAVRRPRRFDGARRTSSGCLAMLAAMRWASLLAPRCASRRAFMPPIDHRSS